MKDLEFRAWVKEEKKMIDVFIINFIDKKIKTLYGQDCINWEYTFDNIELMLGLKVYNKMVFVGDVIRIYGGEQMFGYYEIDKIKIIKEIEDLFMLFNMDYGIDILGNIYENPELSEVK